MNIYQAISHSDDLYHVNNVATLALSNDNVFPGSTRLTAAQHHLQPEQQGHGCQPASTSSCSSDIMSVPADTMYMKRICYGQPPVVPVISTTISDTQSATSDVSWDVGMCGGGQGDVVPVLCPGTDTGTQQPVSAINNFFQAFLMSQQHSWASWSLAWGNSP